jgi:hypothetical protein
VQSYFSKHFVHLRSNNLNIRIFRHQKLPINRQRRTDRQTMTTHTLALMDLRQVPIIH